MPKIFGNGTSLDINEIRFDTIPINLFDQMAESAAKIIADNPDSNKPTQIRKFYDELCLWYEKVHRATDKKQAMEESLPFIRMMKAKMAYAKGRNQKDDKRDPTLKDRTGLVDKNFLDVFNHCIDQIKDYESLKNCKLFFEAFLGFYKVERPKD